MKLREFHIPQSIMRDLEDRIRTEILTFSINLLEGEEVIDADDKGVLLVMCHASADKAKPASVNGHLIPIDVQFDKRHMTYVGRVRDRALYIEVIPGK